MKNFFRKIPRHFPGYGGGLPRSYTLQKPHPENKPPYLNRPARGYHKKQRGQGLVEYLILIALMGVATIGIIRTLNQTIKSRFANAIYALQGRKQKAKTHALRKEEYQRSDLSNFMTGAASSDETKRSKRD